MLVASVALADSINPSTVVPALYLAGGPRGRGLATYTLGVFMVYLTGGIVLVLGPGPSLIAALHRAGPRFEHGAEALIGLAALAFALFIWRSRHGAEEPRRRRFDTRVSAFALGAGISAIELPTAFLYFGVVTAILNSSAGAGTEIALVVAYNALFVLPLVAIIALRTRIRRRLATVMAWTWRSGPALLAGIATLVGAGLLGIGVSGLL
jgi:cytochrome c biogenesis protein CcdA